METVDLYCNEGGVPAGKNMLLENYFFKLFLFVQFFSLFPWNSGDFPYSDLQPKRLTSLKLEEEKIQAKVGEEEVTGSGGATALGILFFFLLSYFFILSSDLGRAMYFCFFVTFYIVIWLGQCISIIHRHGRHDGCLLLSPHWHRHLHCCAHWAHPEDYCDELNFSFAQFKHPS